MKRLNYLLSAVVLLGVLVTVGCGGDDGPGKTAEAQLLETFSKTWNLSSATLDGQTAENMDGMTLTVSANKSYSTNAASLTRKPNPWPSNGTFTFDSEITDPTKSQFNITREDGLKISVTLSNTSLSLSFKFVKGTHSGQGSKDEEVGGDWVMTFAPQ